MAHHHAAQLAALLALAAIAGTAGETCSAATGVPRGVYLPTVNDYLAATVPYVTQGIAQQAPALLLNVDAGNGTFPNGIPFEWLFTDLAGLNTFTVTESKIEKATCPTSRNTVRSTVKLSAVFASPINVTIWLNATVPNPAGGVLTMLAATAVTFHSANYVAYAPLTGRPGDDAACVTLGAINLSRVDWANVSTSLASLTIGGAPPPPEFAAPLIALNDAFMGGVFATDFNPLRLGVRTGMDNGVNAMTSGSGEQCINLPAASPPPRRRSPPSRKSPPNKKKSPPPKKATRRPPPKKAVKRSPPARG